ncbi:MAG: HD domain-containing protein, partial [Bacteroidota bacterium]
MIWKFPYYEIDKPINWDVLIAQFEWLHDMKGVPQDPIWHEEGDVWVHTQMVVEELVQLEEFLVLDEQDKHILFAAALLHDVEKRSTTTIEIIDNIERIISPKHAKKGEYMVRALLYKDIPTPFFIREQIAKLVRLHGLPLWAIEKDDPRKSVIEASLSVNTAHLTILAKADVLGRICKDKEKLLLKIELFKELCIEHQCFDSSRKFPSHYGRYLYLNKAESSP